MFNNTKAAQKRKASMEFVDKDSMETGVKFMRKSVKIKEDDKSSSKLNKLCFLCDKPSPLKDMRQAMTMKLNNILKECASTLLDEKLLAKLSRAGIISQEFVYHPQCLANLYNRERAFLSSKDRSNIELEKTN